ncbi:MAG: hypothetical protein IPK67_14845 [Planctomycetes bacterium]|nr:hypothetical protein [Planctomycetota bacterium]
MEIRIAHGLATEELSRRIRAAAERHEVEFFPGADPLRGTLTKDAGFLGSVRAEYAIEAKELVVVIRDRPGFLPEGTLRRILSDELSKLVAG